MKEKSVGMNSVSQEHEDLKTQIKSICKSIGKNSSSISDCLKHITMFVEMEKKGKRSELKSAGKVPVDSQYIEQIYTDYFKQGLTVFQKDGCFKDLYNHSMDLKGGQVRSLQELHLHKEEIKCL